MKVAVVPGTPMRMSWARVLERIGYKVAVWNPKDKPAFDFFHEVEPELLILGTKDLSRAIVKNIIRRPHLRVMLWASNWGLFDTEIDREGHGFLLATDDEKQLVKAITGYSYSPTKVYAPYHQRRVDETHDRWANLGLTPVGIPPAADLSVFQQGTFDRSLESDIAFVGHYHESYGPSLYPLCHASSGMRVKIFGTGGWPVAQYLGTISPQYIKNVFASAKVCPNLAVPHALAYGFDVGERPFQIVASGSLCVSQCVSSLGIDFFSNDEIVIAPEQYFDETVRHFVAHPEEGIPYIERGLRSIHEKHTYYHRVDAGLENLGLTHGRDKLKTILENLREGQIQSA
jgi:hypothetical protein